MKVATVVSQFIEQGRDSVMVPVGGVPVLAPHFDERETAAAVANFLRCGCPAVQQVFSDDLTEGHIEERLRTTLAVLGRLAAGAAVSEEFDAEYKDGVATFTRSV